MIHFILTSDFKRVVDKLKAFYQKKNLTETTPFQILVFSPALERFEGVFFRFENLLQAIKRAIPSVFIFQNFCPFCFDEIVCLSEMTLRVPVEVYIVGTHELLSQLPREVAHYVEIYEDFYPQPEEVPPQFPFYPGLTLAQIKKAVSLGKNLEEERRQILRGYENVLEIFSPTAKTERAVGLDHIIKYLESFAAAGGRGCIFVGVPGTGKTLTALNLAFNGYTVLIFHLESVYRSYVGESESLMRQTIAIVEQFASTSPQPVFLLVDELEKRAAHGTGATDSGVSYRVLSILLNFLERHPQNLYVIGTVNNLSALPPELVRPGRWDCVFGFVPPPAHVKELICEYYSKKYNLPIFSFLVDEDLITPADIATFYFLTHALQDEKEALALFRPSKDILPGFLQTCRIVEEVAVPVWRRQ